MLTRPFWIDTPPPGRLAIMPAPMGGEHVEAQFRALRAGRVDVVVSLLTTTDAFFLALADEADACRKHGISFECMPIVDQDVPSSLQETSALVRRIVEHLAESRGVAVHCQGGIGRSGLVTACVLGALGLDVEEAFERIARARGLPVPETEEQRAWAAGFVERHRRSP